MASGQLGPGEAEFLTAGGGQVDFWIGDTLVATATFPQDPGTVTLVTNADGTYAIQVAGSDSSAAS